MVRFKGSLVSLLLIAFVRSNQVKRNKGQQKSFKCEICIALKTIKHFLRLRKLPSVPTSPWLRLKLVLRLQDTGCG